MLLEVMTLKQTAKFAIDASIGCKFLTILNYIEIKYLE